MQRRDFVRTALFGTGALCSLALPSANAALRSEGQRELRVALARCESRNGASRWRALDQCSSGECTTPQRVRIAIDALGFPSTFGGFAIDAMFDTQAGLRPFRIASHQPASLSPTSKPFSFEADSAGLAGFRAEHAERVAGAITVGSASLLGPSRPVLDAGRYLLMMTRDSRAQDLEALVVPDSSTHPIVAANGEETRFGWLTFTVHPLISG